MKIAAFLMIAAFTALLCAACESTAATKAPESQRGVPLGDSNVRVSGSLSTGGTITR